MYTIGLGTPHLQTVAGKKCLPDPRLGPIGVRNFVVFLALKSPTNYNNPQFHINISD